jgi:hypothetical protein
MSLDRAIKMLGRHGYVEHNENGEYWSRINGFYVGFYKNGESSTTCYHTRRVGSQSDLQSDYDANDYWDNLTQAIRYAELGHSHT